MTMRARWLIWVLVFIGLLCLSQPNQSRAWWQSIQQASVVSVGGCTQATNFLARTSGSPHTSVFTTMICNLVTQGVWAKLDAFYFPATDTSGNAVLNLISSSFAATNHGTTFTADAGWTGTDSSSTIYVDTGFDAATAGGNATQNSFHISLWSNTNTTSGVGGGVAMGVNGVTTFAEILPKYNDGNSYYRANTATGGSATNANSTGHYLANRSGANADQGYKNSSSVTAPNTASTALNNGNIYLLARNLLGTGPSNGSGIQLMTATVGGSLSAGDVTNLCHEQNVALTAIAGISSVC